MTQSNKSNYAKNYRLFQRRISDLNAAKPGYLLYLVRRILNNGVLLPIEADNQNTALRIFTTLNDRGMPLSDADIFKTQFYKFFAQYGKQSKESFIKRWKALAELCNKNFRPHKGTPVDDLFMRYYYYAKTKKSVEQNCRISETFSDMRDFYAENNYEILRDKETYADLETLATFWNDFYTRSNRFSPEVLKKLYVLSYSPYSLWSYVVSLYFMSNRDLNAEKFCAFLDGATAMILMNAVLELGTQNIRRPFVLEFKDIFRGEPLKFDAQFKRDDKILRRRLQETKFSNSKAVTRAMLAWWNFQNPAQELPPPDTKLHIEHIYAKKRHELHPLNNAANLELLGNKALLEDRVNIRATDYRLVDKKLFYLGSGKSDGTFNLELRRLAEDRDDFTERDILERNEEIFEVFVEYLRAQELLT